jgi:hypothetical protein
MERILTADRQGKAEAGKPDLPLHDGHVQLEDQVRAARLHFQRQAPLETAVSKASFQKVPATLRPRQRKVSERVNRARTIHVLSKE